MDQKSPHIRMRDVAKIYDSVDFGLLIVTSDGTIIWGNKYYSSLSGLDIREFYGKNVRELSEASRIELPTKDKIIDIVLETKKAQTEIVRYPTEDYILTTAVPTFDEDGNIDYIVYTLTNYTQTLLLHEKVSQSSMQILALEDHLNDIQLSQTIGKDIIIADRKMYNIYGQALKLAPTSVSVMLTGESGTGKDILARFIHRNSEFKNGNFIHVNIASIPPALFESELFGYEQGSFTGASRKGKTGLIQLADNGTLFLDEIGELPFDIQSKLLQVIQDKEVRSIGSTKTTPVNFRLICATNRDLQDMLRKGRFRLDLYYRLITVEFTLPPLRERPDDIPLLIGFFLDQFNQKNHSQKKLSKEIFRRFQSYPWPGNIRELQHTIESLVVLCPQDIITPDFLPAQFQEDEGGDPFSSLPSAENLTLKQAVELLESNMIKSTLAKSPTANAAAERLGIDPSTLSKKRKHYGI